MKKIYASLMAIVLFGVQMSFAQVKRPFQITKGSKNFTITTTTAKPTPAFSFTPVTKRRNGLSSDRCGFITQRNRALAAGYDPAAFELAINNKIAEIEADRAAGRVTAAQNYIIPVIFHIINDGTAEGVGANVAATQVYEQISQLNKDFGNQSGSPFAVAANSGISFCPVLANPSGTALAQPGIERINRIARGWNDPTLFTDPGDGTGLDAMINYIDATIKPASIWDPTKYVNIWAYDFSQSGLLGYATFPTAGLSDLPAGEDASTAGAVFLSGALGSVASPGPIGQYGLGRTITHELGHFFGLYHTWGDLTSCNGTDYCADTPPCSDEYYSTSPGCTVPTQCSSLPRMIADYMDYSDDGCMNTYTQNQVDRMQAVMALAPRRPKNPVATICTPAVANALSFTNASTTFNVSEASVATTCPKYTDYAITVQPAIAASGNATVNFTFAGTATQNVDYAIIGSTSLSYVSGESTAKGFTVRVFDDGAVESAETIDINFAISGTGLVPSTVNLISSFSITDNDVTAYINNTAQSTQLMNETFGTTANSGALPTGWIKQNLLSTAGTNLFTVNGLYGASTGFTTATNGRVLHITNGSATAQTNETANAIYTANSESDVVVITKSIVTTGYGNIKVTFDYACAGESDPNGLYDLGAVLYSTTSQTTGFNYLQDVSGGIFALATGDAAKRTITLTLPADAANSPNLWLAFEWYNDNSIRTLPPLIIDNVIVTGENSAVETVLNQSVTNTQNTGQNVQYMSSTNKIIASISGLNSNVGCISANVQYAGNNISPLITAAGTYQRSDKVIKITPATANTTATYQATFYYTTAELSAWGTNVPNLKILKVKDGVDIFGNIGATDAVVFTPTVDDQRATKGYVSYTINATGGFSQFLLVSPTIVLPVLSLQFTAKGNDKNISLNWSTNQEINNKGFAIERSTDGVTFEKIGWVNGVGNSSKLSNYAYTDNFVQPNIVYSYRLRQTDIDSRIVTSETRTAKINGSGIDVLLSPNPSSDFVKLFVSGTTGLATIKLYNAQGQVVRSWNKINVATVATLDITNLAKGVYIFNIKVGEKTQVEKLIVN